MKNNILVVLFYPIGYGSVFAQKKDKKLQKKEEIEVKKDSTSTSYESLLKGAKTKNGLLKVHQVKEKIYFENS